VDWLVVSIALSVLLTVVLNIGLRIVPGAGDRLTRRLDRLTAPGPAGSDDGRRVRVVAPWKAMLVVSVVLTIGVNLVLWIT
jgi:hypothetical protein